ncbi:hypothetical protein [Streptomyces sp. CFMR 7]|uniref:hypothetical protein n=1 Tax=Streptomyces sp. CFMR 7 TaxID=1649184 RepID=UPI0037D9B89C
MVAEVGYTTRTQDRRLRQPSWHRLRPDLTRDSLLAARAVRLPSRFRMKITVASFGRVDF